MRAWLQLLRAALAPTVLWDVVAGTWLAGARLNARALAAMAASLLVYHGGMVLNDWADRRRDAGHRPERPIPSGAVPPPAALCAAAVLLAGGMAAGWLLLPPDAVRLVCALAAIAVLYDLGGPLLRHYAGPWLLATARAGTLCLGAVASGDLVDLYRSAASLWPAASYSFYFLFTSRLATYEEQGISGPRGAAYAAGSCLGLIFLTRIPGVSWAFAAGAAATAACVLLPILQTASGFWPPQRVRLAVRRSLAAAPLVPGLALLAAGHWTQASAAPAVALLVAFLARRIPPE